MSLTHCNVVDAGTVAERVMCVQKYAAAISARDIIAAIVIVCKFDCLFNVASISLLCIVSLKNMAI